MVILKILCFFLAAAFLLFGYLIYFRKSFHFINGFMSAYREGRKTERDALRVGLVELVLGTLLLLVGILLLIFA